MDRGWPALRALPASISWLHTAPDLPPGSSLVPHHWVSPPPARPPPPPSRPLAHSPGALEVPRPLLQPARGRWTRGPMAGGVVSLPAGLELAWPVGAGGARVGRPEGLWVPNLCSANSGSYKALGF